jgi:CHAD domain-containing protein
MPRDQERVKPVFQKVEKQLSKVASKPLPETVHRFRTSTRRIEALLGDLIPQQDRNQRKLLKELSRLRRRAGGVRDVDVQVAALRGLKAPHDADLKAEVLRSLAEMRAKREAKLLKALDKQTVRGLRKRLKRAARKPEILKNSRDPLAVASQMFARLTRVSSPLREELLHQYRIKSKRIRYVAELAGDRPEAQQLVEQLKRMQDALGEWHDLLTLRETVQKHVGDDGRSALLAELSNITRAKFREAVAVVQETKSSMSAKPVVMAPAKVAGRKPVASQKQLAAAIA